ncbi:MAG TPA: agmatinase family protein [Elainellaceae cyanobacterium]|jgi:agmatinase
MTTRNNSQGFDPSSIGIDNGNLCGLPFDYDSAKIILVGIPWEVTVSYHAGTALGPHAVLNASRQLDLYDFDNPNGWKQGIFMAAISDSILETNHEMRKQASRIIEAMERGKAVEDDPELVHVLTTVNRACEQLNQWLFEQTQGAIAQGKRVGVIGGDHSTPLGCIQALAHHHSDVGILHIDAHADLRDSYEGFQYSHASIMHNVLQLPQISKLVQVGVRDICQAEIDCIHSSKGRISSYFDPVLKQKLYAGIPWLDLCHQIVEELPQQVYVSFDVDGLDPKLCPSTGTPVPGGLELEQAFCLFREIIYSGRHIIGFDVSEVGSSEWDGNVGARAVYKLCNLMGL